MNTYGDNAFIVSIQLPPPEGEKRPKQPGPVLIYDRRRSIDCYVMRIVDFASFKALEDVERREEVFGTNDL